LGAREPPSGPPDSAHPTADHGLVPPTAGRRGRVGRLARPRAAVCLPRRAPAAAPAALPGRGDRLAEPPLPRRDRLRCRAPAGPPRAASRSALRESRLNLPAPQLAAADPSTELREAGRLVLEQLGHGHGMQAARAEQA